MDRKIPTTILFDRTLLEALDKLSMKTGKSKSALIAEALTKFLEVPAV